MNLAYLRARAEALTERALQESGCVTSFDERVLHEASELVARGVRPLYLCTGGAETPLAKEAMLAHLTAEAQPGALPFLAEDRNGIAGGGYAAASWVIDLCRWVIAEIESPRRDQLLGLLLGYSVEAISGYVDRLP